MQKAVHHPGLLHGALNDCRQMVSGSISLRLPRFFSPFPHGTGSLSIWQQYLALEGGPPIFSQGFSCPDLLEQSVVSFYIRDYHPLWSNFPVCSTNTLQILGLVPFRSPLLWESRLISFPEGTEMFHFPSFAPRRVTYLSICWVAPFGNPRIKASWQLPEAYRSLVRPSSPLPVQASTICPQFNLFYSKVLPY